jgi:hypothetical protein
MLIQALILRKAIDAYTIINRDDLQDDILSDND